MKKEIGKRIKLARQTANLTRRQLADKYKINYHTLESWEKGVNQISENNLIQLEKFFQQEGLNISKNWILYGNTKDTVDSLVKGIRNTKVEDIYSLDGDLSYFKEIRFFLENAKNSITAMVLDDALFPFYCKGDYVGGIMLRNIDMRKCVGHFCIIKITNGDIVTRKIINITKDMAKVCSINPKAILTTPDYQTVNYENIAPITRHWSC